MPRKAAQSFPAEKGPASGGTALPTGTVKYVDPTGRWGMISRDDKQPKVFVHSQAVRDLGLEGLRKGQRFRFRVDPHPTDRPQAADLEILDN